MKDLYHTRGDRRGADLSGADLRGADLRKYDLRETDLRGALLFMADLRDAYLRRAVLHEADLHEADLKRADLEGADLRGANLRGANLRGADLREADLRGTDLHGADLFRAYLRGANLRGADLHEACLFEANLREADLHEANLTGVDLNGANLRRSDLRGFDLRGVTLWGADLREADLREADLRGASLRDANLYKADLRGADLEGAKMEGADLRKAIQHEADLAGANGRWGWDDRLHSLRRSIDRMGEVRLGDHLLDLLLLVPVVLLLIFGIWQAFFEASDLGQELQRATASSVMEIADLAGAEPGTDAVLGGRLGVAGEGSHIADDAAGAYHLVLYERQRWKCTKDNNGGYDGRWGWSAYVSPDVITLDGREVAIVLDRPTDMSGELFSSPMVEEGDGRRCDGRTEGSIRFVGYRDGDSVCVFGRKGSDEILVVERLHGDDCESLITYLEGQAHGARKTGVILLGIGLLVGFL